MEEDEDVEAMISGKYFIYCLGKYNYCILYDYMHVVFINTRYMYVVIYKYCSWIISLSKLTYVYIFYPIVCRLPVDAGRCTGYYIRFYFNSAKNTCEKFVYGGCGGNRNRFETRRECRRTCRRYSATFIHVYVLL